MKTLLLSLCLFFAVTVSAQSLTYQSTSIMIYNDGGWCTSPQNSIRVYIESNVSDVDTLYSLFPQYKNSFKYLPETKKFSYTFDSSAPNIWEILTQVEIEPSDVGMKGDAFLKKWMRNLLYSQNYLELDLTDWNLTD